MNFHDYTPVQSLNTSKVRWTIRVRAQAIWKGVNRETDTFKGYNIIFFDDSKCRIHAFLNAKYAHLFDKDLEEGQVYKISNFLVKQFLGHEPNRCVRNENHLYFAAYTKMEKDSTYNFKIPQHSFDFVDLMDIPQFETDTRFLCDVVGVITEVDNLREYENDNKDAKKQMNFSITDGSTTTKVTFFDQFAKKFQDAFEKDVNEHTVIILTSAKVHKFQGNLYLTNYPASRFYLEDNHYAVEELRLKAKDPCFFKKKMDNVNEFIFHSKTVRDIKQLTSNFIGKKIVTEITVKQVEEEHRWYYYICNTCEEEVKFVDGRYKCEPCKRRIPFPDKRYRLHTVCVDKTGLINIVFPDREVRRLAGNNVFVLDLEEPKMEEKPKYPAILRDIEMQIYTVTVMVTEENVNKGYHIYHALEVLQGSKTLGPNSPSNYTAEETNENNIDTDVNLAEPILESTTPTAPPPIPIVETEAEESPTIYTTPITRRSAMKPRARKSNEKDDDFKDENVGANKFKNIKTEKVYNKRA